MISQRNHIQERYKTLKIKIMAWAEIKGYPNTIMQIKLPNVISESKYLFFNHDGEYLTGPVDDSKKVYLTTETILKTDIKTREEWETIMTNSTKLNNGIDEDGLTYKDFKHFAATILGESSAGYGVIIKEEIYAFASANDNYKKWYKQKNKKDISYRFVISKTGAYAVGNSQYEFYNSKTEDERNNKKSMKYANAAVINAILNGEDYSKGATKWSGIDIVTSEKEKWKQGYKFTDLDHDIFYLDDNKKSGESWWDPKTKKKIRAKWDYKWESRAAFSGVNNKKTNPHWQDYKKETKNPGRAFMKYYEKDKPNAINVDEKDTFFKTETGYLFGTIFCRLTKEYIKAQGGEFY